MHCGLEWGHHTGIDAHKLWDNPVCDGFSHLILSMSLNLQLSNLIRLKVFSHLISILLLIVQKRLAM